MKTSESIAKIAPALLEAQRAIEAVAKTADNPFFNSHYADLTAVIAAIKEPLNAHGITFLQAVGTEGNGPVVETMLLHSSGEYLSTTTPVYCKKPDDPQAFGSGVTYSKRYALQAIVGLATEDDDGEGAMNRGKGKPKKPPTKPDVDLASMKSDKGVAFLKKYGTAKRALAELSKTKNVTRDAEAFINELFETEGAAA